MLELAPITEGTVVFVEVSGELRAARVVHADVKLISIDVGEGALQKLRRDRITHVSRFLVSDEAISQGGAAGEVARYFAEVQTLSLSLELEELWELVLEQEERISLVDLADLALPGLVPEGVDALVVALYREPIYFKVHSDGVEPVPERTVHSLRIQREREGARREMEETILGELRKRIESSTSFADPPEGKMKEVLSEIEELAIHGVDHPGGRETASLLSKVAPGSLDKPDLAAFDVLVRLGIWDVDENLDIHRHEIRMVFPDDVLVEAEQLGSEDVDATVEAAIKAGRRDLRDVPLVAIDDLGTTDVDDALGAESLEGGGYRIWVVISDVSAFISRDSLLGEEAQRRSSSLYLPKKKISMIPPILSEGILSLEEGVNRLALAFSFEVSAAGEMSPVSVEEVVVRVSRQYTYEEVQEILTEGKESPHSELLRVLCSVGNTIRSTRAEQGGVMLRQPEWKVHVEASGEVHVHRCDPNSLARELVAELMIGTCALVGDYCVNEGIGAVFRTQPPASERVEFEESEADDPFVTYSVLQHMKRAVVSVDPSPHYSLGVDRYVQVTSPIRRYQDFLMHIQLKRHLRGELQLTREELGIEGAQFEVVGGLFRRIERNARRYWVLRHLEKRPGESIRAVILRPIGRRWLANCPDFGIGVLVTPSKPVEGGDEVTIRVRKVDPRRDQIHFDA